MINKKIVFRADGSAEIGLGHIMRCMAIEQMLHANFVTAFAIFKPTKEISNLIQNFKVPLIELVEEMETSYCTSYDAVVLDGYNFDSDYCQSILQLNKKLIQVDDIPTKEYYANLLLNHAINADYSKAVFHNPVKLLIGIEYVILRKEFLDAASKKEKNLNSEHSITISMGGADPNNNTCRIIQLLTEIEETPTSINILLGVSYSHKKALSDIISNIKTIKINILEGLDAKEMVALLSNTSLFICSASTVVYEALAVKVPVACFMTAQNQLQIYEGLVTVNAVNGLGDLTNLNDSVLKNNLTELMSHYKNSNSNIDSRILIDGHSGDRIQKEIQHLWN